MVMDVLWGTILATALLMMLTVSVVRQTKAQKQLTRDRTASRAAEDALLALQAGEPLPAGATMDKLPDAAPAGRTWIRVHATFEGRPADLVGLVKADAAQGAH
jgi:hypothetical protein